MPFFSHPAADVLAAGEQPTPEPAKGEVLVRLMTSGVNPSDVKKRAGAFPNLLDDGLIIPHSDGAGVIESLGQGVSDRQVGKRVWVYQAQFGRRFGSAAESVAIDSSRAPLLPENTSFEIGACLGIPGTVLGPVEHTSLPGGSVQVGQEDVYRGFESRETAARLQERRATSPFRCGRRGDEQLGEFDVVEDPAQSLQQLQSLRPSF